jgi:hypothetical protein
LKSKIIAVTFALVIGPRFQIGVKREVRLDSGAIPVAVISFLIQQLEKENLISLATVSPWARREGM